MWRKAGKWMWIIGPNHFLLWGRKRGGEGGLEDNSLFIFRSADRWTQSWHFFLSIFTSISNLIGFTDKKVLEWNVLSLSPFIDTNWATLPKWPPLIKTLPGILVVKKYFFLKFILKYFLNSESSILHVEQSHKVSSNILNGTDTIWSWDQQLISRHEQTGKKDYWL